MNHSTMPHRFSKRKQLAEIGAAIAMWLLIWFLISKSVAINIILPTPITVLKEIIRLAQTTVFWLSVCFSLLRILLGFLLAFFVGNLLAALSYRFRPVLVFLQPMLAFIKAAPVASYSIICVFFLPLATIPLFIAFLMSLPIVYQNMLSGLENTSKELLEMAQVYRISTYKKITVLYFSQTMPYLVSASSLALGLSWKSGIAAEVIAMPLLSIGEHLSAAKVFFDMPAAFAWTVVVVAISFLLEKSFLLLLRLLSKKVAGR